MNLLYMANSESCGGGKGGTEKESGKLAHKFSRTARLSVPHHKRQCREQKGTIARQFLLQLIRVAVVRGKSSGKCISCQILYVPLAPWSKTTVVPADESIFGATFETTTTFASSGSPPLSARIRHRIKLLGVMLYVVVVDC